MERMTAEAYSSLQCSIKFPQYHLSRTETENPNHGPVCTLFTGRTLWDESFSLVHNALTLHSGCLGFESEPEGRFSWLKFSVIFPSPCRVFVTTFKQATAVSFHIFLNPSFAIILLLRRISYAFEKLPLKKFRNCPLCKATILCDLK